MVQHLTTSPEAPSVNEELMETLREWTEAKPRPQVKPFRRQIVWFNLLGFLLLHVTAVYAFFLGLLKAKFLTIAWTVLVAVAAGQGVTMGAHRLFSHKAFKAKPALRLALVLLQTMAGQNCLYIWVRDHRQHHKYSDTDGDPHNSQRGFFFSHIGWLMVRKHPEVIAKGKTIDMSDLEADPFVMFQKKYYKTLYTLLSIGVPVAVPYYLWGEDLYISFMFCFLVRTILSLNATWLVNSAAHKYGTRPYTKAPLTYTRDIVPVESALVSMCVMGEGWHNYHHTFPWDYKAAELGQKYNLTTTLLDMLERWGWVYDLRSASHNMVLHRVQRRGDGSHPVLGVGKYMDTETTVERPIETTKQWPKDPIITTLYSDTFPEGRNVSRTTDELKDHHTVTKLNAINSPITRAVRNPGV